MDLGHWLLYKDVEFLENAFGFIYLIENHIDKKFYIGKKQCFSKIKRKPLKGKTRCRRDSKESDWKSYTSSSEKLNEDIKKHGKENFSFYILKFCSCKWELAFYEIKEQIERNVLFRTDSYNGIINVRIGRPPTHLLLPR